MSDLPRSVQSSVQLYRHLTRLYPREFRRDYQTPMAEVFTDMAFAAHQGSGPLGLARLWLWVLRDLACSILREHFRTENRRPPMRTAVYAVASIVLAIVVQWFVMMLIGLGILLLTIGNLMAESPQPPAPWWFHLLELVMFFLPAFLAAMLLVHTRPVYRPWLTAPLGAMALVSVVAIKSAAPWWGQALIVLVVGALSVAGCYAGSRIPPWRRKEHTDPQTAVAS